MGETIETLTPKDRRCEDCEYFDIGLVDRGGESDCLNRLSPRFQTHRDWWCVQWVRSS